MMITEATSTSTKDLMRYYGVFDRREADFPMNFGLMALGLDGTLDQNIIKTLIQGGFTNGCWPLIGSVLWRHPSRSHRFEIFSKTGWQICQKDESQIGLFLATMKNASCPGNVS